MTTSRTRKPAKKAASKTADSPAPMDATVREVSPEQAAVINHPRSCYALQTLVAEVETLFPEVTHETLGANGRNTAIAVMFDEHETPDLWPLLSLLTSDPRVESTDIDSAEQKVLVQFRNDPRVYDSRAPFGLSDAYKVLSDGGTLALDGDANFVVVEDDL